MDDIQTGLAFYKGITGLGVAGISGLLALLFTNRFATVDQFVVDALYRIDQFENDPRIQKLHLKVVQKGGVLTLRDGVFLIGVIRDKAEELNS